MRVVLATGGTGGHIYPALALEKEIQKNEPSEVLFIGTTDRMEATLLPQLGYQYYGLDVQGVIGKRQSYFDKAKSLVKLAKAKKEVKKIIEDFKPDIVVGFGNYLTVPVIQAAHELKIPTLLHEQNSTAGKANKLLAHIADKVVISIEESKKDFPEKKTILLGNPRASEAVSTIKDDNVLTSLNLSNEKKTVLIVMGSLGSSSINQTMKEALIYFDDVDYQVIFVSGKDDFDTFKEVSSDNVKIVPFVDQIALMKVIDLMVSRSGATTIAEISALGIPSILIPSPYVTNNHQHFNAQALVNSGVAIELPENQLTSKKLFEMIDSYINDDDKLMQMRENGKNAGFPNAANDIYKLMKEMIKR